MSQLLPDPALDRLEEALDADAIWVYGSQARGTAHPGSDVDLAVLCADAPDAGLLVALAGELEGRLGRPVDLVDVGRASPILAMQVLRYGVLVRERRRASRVAFQAALTGRYEDLKIIRREAERRLVARWTEG